MAEASGFFDVEFSGFHDAPVHVGQLVDIDPPVQIVDIYADVCIHPWNVQYLLSQEIIYPELRIFLRIPGFEFEEDRRGGGVGIAPYLPGHLTVGNCARGFRLPEGVFPQGQQDKADDD